MQNKHKPRPVFTMCTGKQCNCIETERAEQYNGLDMYNSQLKLDQCLDSTVAW